MGTKERKLRELDNRRTLILITAKNLFSQKGFANVTLEDIAREIEFSKGTIYSHFRSKEELYAHILLEQLQILLTYLRQAVLASRNTEDGIQRCLHAYLRFYNQHKQYFQLLFFIDLVSDRYKIPVKVMMEIQKTKLACLTELQRLLEKRKNTREVTAGLPFKEAALVLWGMINGILHLAESRQVKAKDLDQLIDVGFRIVLHGLKNNEKPEGDNHGHF